MTGSWQLAHAASAMGIVAAENATGGRREFRGLVPNCIFTNPEIGVVGTTESECVEKGLDVTVGRYPFAALGKAMAIGETAGFCKIVADRETDQVLGIHIIGPHATDLIAEAVTGMQLEITSRELAYTIHPHPTLGEVIMETACAVQKRASKR